MEKNLIDELNAVKLQLLDIKNRGKQAAGMNRNITNFEI
jgi:hypothetical protein